MKTVAIKDLLNDSDLSSRVFASLLGLRADWRALRGRRFDALDLRMRAWRAAGQAASDYRGERKIRRMIAEFCYQDGQLLPISENRLLGEFVRSPEAQAIREEYARYPADDAVRLRLPRPEHDPERQGDLMVLKRFDPQTGEKGVLLVTYTEAIRRFASMFDLSAIASRYMIVQEPSWWGYSDLTFLLYLGSDLDVLIQSPWPGDYQFIKTLGSNLVPTRLGAGDWIDPATFRPSNKTRRAYDLVMVSAWSPVKRHRELFQTMAKLRREGHRPLRVALIGYPGGWTRDHIERMMREYGVEDCCTIFENIPHEQVAEIVADSHAYVLLSRREGANRALYEAFFCDTPVIVYAKHRGVNLDHITDEVGVLFENGELDQAILRAVDDAKSFRPRAWAEAHTGWDNSTRILNEALCKAAGRRGEPWTTDIAAKKMAPNLRYAEPGLYRTFDAEYDALKQYLLPAVVS